MVDYLYDVFVSHASEDKRAFVDDLVEAFENAGLRVWYDTFTLTVGDGLDENVRRGINSSRFHVLVLSSHFMEKHWTRLELDLLLECPGRLLQVWHGVDASQVRAFRPTLADQVSLSSARGAHAVALELLKRMRIHHESTVPVIEHYHGTVRVTPAATPDHYVEILQVGGVFRVPRGTPLLYQDLITNSSPQGSIDFFDTVPPQAAPGLDEQKFKYFNIAGPESASVMPICGLMHATKRFASDNGYVALRLPYFTKFVTLTFDYEGLLFDLPEPQARIHAQTADSAAAAVVPKLTHWRGRRYVVLQAADLPAGSNPMLGWGKWRSMA